MYNSSSQFSSRKTEVFGNLTRKERYAYQRLVTGLSIGGHRDAYFRFMTLTSSPDSPKDINKSFDLLKKWIARATPTKIRKLNRKYHVNLPLFEGFKFNHYFKLKTAEGYNVLHIVYWGTKQHFIPQAWLQWVWDYIHGAFKADIRIVWRRHRTRKSRINGLVGYLLTNYLTKQPILRMSYGWRWAWLGFCRSWDHVKCEMSLLRRGSVDLLAVTHSYISAKIRFRNCALEYWRFLTKNPLSSSRQVKFCNCDHSRFTKKWSWFENSSKVLHKVPVSKPLVLVGSGQAHLCDVTHTKGNHYIGMPEIWSNKVLACLEGRSLADLGWYDKSDFDCQIDMDYGGE